MLWTHGYFNGSSDGLVSPAEEYELGDLVVNRIHPNEEDLQDKHGSTTTSGSLTKCTCALSPSRQGSESEQSTSGDGRGLNSRQVVGKRCRAEP